MTGLKQRLFRRRASGSPGPGASGPKSRPLAGLLRRGRGGGAKRRPWGKRAEAAALPNADGSAAVHVVETAGGTSFRDRGKLRRRLQYLRRARELAFRDVGGLIFDMRRFGRERPDLVEAKLTALAAVDQELRAIERVLDDRRPIHELREPGLSSCARCGALHASEDHFCPRCGLQIGGPQAMGEVGGAIAAPPQAPPAPVEQPTAATLIAPAPFAPPPAPAPAPSSRSSRPPRRAPCSSRSRRRRRASATALCRQPTPGLGYQPGPASAPPQPQPPRAAGVARAPAGPRRRAGAAAGATHPARDPRRGSRAAARDTRRRAGAARASRLARDPRRRAGAAEPPAPPPATGAAPPQPTRSTRLRPADGSEPGYPEDAQRTEIYRPSDAS